MNKSKKILALAMLSAVMSISSCAVIGGGYNSSSDSVVDTDRQEAQEGSKVLSGIGEPDKAIGNEGDYYVNTANYDVYEKNAYGWTLIDNLKGEKGEKGDKGDAGKDGADGKNGADGKDGQDAITISRASSTTGTARSSMSSTSRKARPRYTKARRRRRKTRPSTGARPIGLSSAGTNPWTTSRNRRSSPPNSSRW